MTEATFNKEEFAVEYITAMLSKDVEQLTKMITELKEEDKADALAAVIQAIEETPDIGEDLLTMLESLKDQRDVAAKVESIGIKAEGKVEEPVAE